MILNQIIDIPQIEKFSCSELKNIDNLWVNNSNRNFGFSVQKEIWLKTGNRLGIKLEDWKDSDTTNYLRFASEVGWYNDGNKNQSIVRWRDYIKTVGDDPYSPKVRGGLPGPATSHKSMDAWPERLTAHGNSFLALRLVNCNI